MCAVSAVRHASELKRPHHQSEGPRPCTRPGWQIRRCCTTGPEGLGALRVETLWRHPGSRAISHRTHRPSPVRRGHVPLLDTQGIRSGASAFCKTPATCAQMQIRKKRRRDGSASYRLQPVAVAGVHIVRAGHSPRGSSRAVDATVASEPFRFPG